MCDSIANGGPVYFPSTGGGGGSCPPANVIIASNVLATNGNVIAGNVISQDGTFYGNLYVAGGIYGNIVYNSLNVNGTANVLVLDAGYIAAGDANIGNLYVANSVTTTNVFFKNTILDINLPSFNTAEGTWGSSANVSQITVDEFGRVSAAANVAITSSQWSTINGNVAYQNGVSIGSLSNPPDGSNLYVLGTATFTNIAGNGSSISSLNSSNLVGNVANATVALVVSQADQPNITSVGTLTGLTVNGLLIVSNASGLANISGSNVTGNVANATVALVVSQADQPNITSVGTLTGLTVNGLLIASNGSAISNLNASNVSIGTLSTSVFPISGVNYGTYGSSSNVAQMSVDQYGRVIAVSNVAITSSQWSTIDGNVAYQNGVSIGSLSNPPSGSNLYVLGLATFTNIAGNGSSISSLNSSNLVGNVANATVALVVSQADQPNITSVGTLTSLTIDGLLICSNASGLANISGSNVTGNVANATVALVVSQAAQPNITSVGLLTNLVVSNSLTTSNVSLSGTLNVLGVSNVTNVYALRYFGDGGLLTNISSSAITQPFANLVVSNTVTTTNILATTANVGTLNVASLDTTGNLSISGNVIPVTNGNTYVLGNLVVAGNVFSSLGVPLGSGGGYYLSLPTDIAIQTGYNGPIYGTTYPLSIGLSNGFTINGTSTLITITHNGNFKFNTAGPYILNGVFTSSDNVTGLAVGSNVADIHGQDQNYLYRYTTFVSQNPTEVIEIPINVTDTSLYYYLDLFKVGAGVLHQTTDPRGGTWLTIAPLTGGGLATGGPGGTPGTQWISSGPNIYFPNSVGIGAVNPAYNLDVTTGTTGTQRLVTSNISSLGLYGPTLNITSNVIIQSNLAVGGGSVPNESPPYALYVTGQGYFSNHVSYQNFAGYRNRCVNGTFRVAARANTITVSNTSLFSYSNTWFVDRWRVNVGGLATSNVSFIVKQDVPIGTTNGFTQCANVYVIRGLTGTTGNTWVCPISQTIEASFIFDFRWGQATAKPAAFSFYANTTVSGDYSVVFRSRQDNTYYANLVSITAGTWLQHVIYLPPCYIGNWAQPSTDGYVDILIGGVSYGVNSSNNGAVAVTSGWTASPGFAPVSCIGATKWPASAGTWLQIAGPQLEEGTIATSFEVRPLTQTYIYCQRFYETNKQLQYAAALGTGHVNSIPFVTTKRNNANVTVCRDLSNLTANTNVSQFVAYYGDGTLKGTQAVTSYIDSDYGFSFNFTNTGSKFMDASIMEAQFVWKADAEIY